MNLWIVEKVIHKMVKYYLHNSNYKDSHVVILGVPDSSGSRSSRANGVEKAPDYIRRLSQKLDVYKWKGERKRRVESNKGIISSNVCDIGNIKKKNVSDRVAEIVSAGKIPITLGGDHSITSRVVNGISVKHKRKFAFVYFDAHPDFRCGFGDYYGSVLCELKKLKNVSFKNSVLIGMRAPEKSELAEIKKSGLNVITPEEIELDGIKKIIGKIKRKIGRLPIYLSVDLDVLDSSIVSAVDTPVPLGLNTLQLSTLIGEVCKNNKVIGADLVELNAKLDENNLTSHLASRLIAEIIFYLNS